MLVRLISGPKFERRTERLIRKPELRNYWRHCRSADATWRKNLSSLRHLPVPSATALSGSSATWTGRPVSSLKSLSKPRSNAPPPANTNPRSTRSAESSGGQRSKVIRTESTIVEIGSSNASRNSRERNKGDLRCASADIDDHITSRILNWKSHTNRRRHRFFDQINFSRASMGSRFPHRALFHFGNSGRDRDHHPRPRAHPAIMDFADEMPQHRLCNFEIGDYTILERANRDNIRRRAAEHPLGLVAYRQHSICAGLHGHHRRLTQNDSLIFDVNKSVRRAQIDPDIAG